MNGWINKWNDFLLASDFQSKIFVEVNRQRFFVVEKIDQFNESFLQEVLAEIVAKSQKPDFHVCHLCGAQYKVPSTFLWSIMSSSVMKTQISALICLKLADLCKTLLSVLWIRISGSVLIWFFWIRIRIVCTDPDPCPATLKLITMWKILIFFFYFLSDSFFITVTVHIFRLLLLMKIFPW